MSLEGSSRTAELAALDEELIEVVASRAPVTVRSVFYLMLGADRIARIDKDSGGSTKNYTRISRRLKKLRLEGRIPFESIVDPGRVVLGNVAWHGDVEGCDPLDALLQLRPHPKALDMIAAPVAFKPRVCGLLTESAGVLQQIGDLPGVDFGMVCKGQAGISALWGIAKHLSGVPSLKLIYVGDLDKAGYDIENAAYSNLCEIIDRFVNDGPEVAIDRIAVTPALVDELGLATKKPKPEDVRFMRERGWNPDSCCEAEAIDPAVLRRMVREAVDAYQSLFAKSDALVRAKAAPVQARWIDWSDCATTGVPEACDRLVDAAESSLRELMPN